MKPSKWDWRGILPYLPPQERRVLWGLAGVVALALGAALWGWFSRNDYEKLLVPLFFQQEEIAPIRADTVGYRPIAVEVPLRWGFGVHVGEVMAPPVWSIWVAGLLVVMGWGALMAAITRMQGFLPYLIYFAWTAWVLMAEAAHTWAGTDPFYVVSLGIALVGAFPAYVGQLNIWRQSLGRTFGLGTGIIAALILLPLLWRKEMSAAALLQSWVAYPSLVLYFGFLIAALHVPLLGAAVWAYLQERTQAGNPLFISGAVVIALLSALLFALPTERAYQLAVPIAFLFVGLGFFFIQPYFPSVAGVFAQPMALLWAWGGLTLIVSGGFVYHGFNHEYMFLYRAGETLRLTLAIGLPLMVLYLGLNFWPLWQARKGFYWDLTKSLRMGLAVYYFGLIAILSFFEARNDWPTASLGLRLYASVRGDHALLRANLDEALAWYQQAAHVVPEEAKVNYNLARLEARSLKDVERSTDRYEKAFSQKPVLPAALQAAVIWLAADRPIAAIQALQRYLRWAPPAAPAYNMLAYAFYRAGYLDSAAYYWKAAIGAEPTDPLYSLNLALLYARHGKPTWASKVLESLSSHKDLIEGLCDNLLYLRLLGYSVRMEGPCTSPNADWLGEAQDTTPVARFMQALRLGDLRAAENIAKYLAEEDADRRAAVMRFLALGYWREGHVRRAAEIFLAAQTPLDSLHAAYAYGEAGCLEMAFQLASRLGALYTFLEKPARLEAALLLSAAGRLSEATFYTPQTEWTDSDYLRFARLVRYTPNLNEAVIILRPFVDRGASYDEPYISVSSMFLAYRDTVGAIENIQAGLSRSRHSVGLKVLWAKIMLAQGRADSALALLTSAQKHLRTREDSLEWWRGYLSYLAFRGSPTEKKAAAQKALEAFPTMSEAQAVLSEIEMESGRTEAAYHRLSEALDVDPYALVLWRAYEKVAAQMGLSEEVDFARQKPDSCPSAL